MMQFTIKDRFKPYVRMTRRGKFTQPQAQEYLASKERLGFEFKVQMHANGWEMLPGQTPLAVCGVVGPRLHNRDLDNEVKAILDAMNGVVFLDDRWVDRIEFSRWDVDETIVIVKEDR